MAKKGKGKMQAEKTAVEPRAFNVGPTKETKAKHRSPVIARLVDNGKIGAEELRAIQEIEDVFERVTIGLMSKSPSSMEKVDGQGPSREPLRFNAAYWDRYRPWAIEWSIRKRRYGDPTLEVVFDILFSFATARDLDALHGFRKGRAVQLFVSGLRDYAASAGWVDRDTAARWQAAARSVFPVRRVRAGAA